MIRAFLLCAFLLNAILSFAQNNYGLRFKSKEVEKKDRTGLDLTKTAPISYQSSFEIKFDLSFRMYEGFGYIFRLKELKSDNQIDLICKLHEASAGLYLVSNRKETEAKINLEKILEHPQNEWNELKAKFNAESGILELSFMGDKIIEKINFPTDSKFAMAFGVVENYGFDTKEVPYISIKNIWIKADGENIHFWPLNNIDGNEAIDTINNKKANINNPEWEIFHHAKWKLTNSATLNEKTQAVYDSNKETIYLVGKKNKIYYFDLNANTFDSIEYSGFSPFYEDGNQIIINQNSELFTYSHLEKTVSRFDFENKRWLPQLECHDSLPKFWHHNRLINPTDSSIVTICGYGFYKYNNLILTFNEKKKNWDTIPFKGDTIYPRYLSALGQHPENKSQYYLFGGFGNKSGDQILGTEFYYDLYRIDFKDSTIQRLWTLTQEKFDDFTPINSLVTDDNGHLYTLCFSHQDESTYLKMLKASANNTSYSFLGDSIPYYFVDILSYADLYYWASTRKLVAITLSSKDEKSFDIQLYTLQFPPGSIDVVKERIGQRGFSIQSIALILLLLIVAITVLVIRKKRQSRKVKTLPENHKGTNKILTEKIKAAPNKESSINLFGGFQVFDKKGKDITYRFSPTLKELFLLLLLHSFRSNKGISSLKIQEILWPDKSPSSAKNNRGVNIKKLRTVLPDIGDIQITYESPYWRLELGEDVFCAYHTVNKFLAEQSEPQKDENLDAYYEFLSYLKRGNMLVNIETEWLDRFKSEISTKIVQFLEQKLKNTDLKQDTNYILETVAIISQFDQLNETALSYKCKVLNCLGEHGLAINNYKNYTKLYQNAYGEEYKLPFKQIIKSN